MRVNRPCEDYTFYRDLLHARAGNEDALVRFIRRIAPRVTLTVAGMMRSDVNDFIVRDIATDALARIGDQLWTSTASTDREVWAWVAMVTRRVFFQAYRSESRRREREMDFGLRQPRYDEPPALEEETSRALTVVSQLLTDVIKSLPEPQWTLLEAHYLENESLKSIGERLGISAEAAAARVRRVRAGVASEMRRRIAALPEPDRTLANSFLSR